LNLVGVLDYFQAKIQRNWRVLSISKSSTWYFTIRNSLLLVSRQNRAYAATWATFILAKRRTINRLIVA
jgi:hypothetical protein